MYPLYMFACKHNSAPQHAGKHIYVRMYTYVYEHVVHVHVSFIGIIKLDTIVQ